MDPDVALARLREAATAILAEPARHSAEAVTLAERVEAMDDWLRRGGFRPADWQRNPTPPTPRQV